MVYLLILLLLLKINTEREFEKHFPRMQLYITVALTKKFEYRNRFHECYPLCLN